MGGLYHCSLKAGHHTFGITDAACTDVHQATNDDSECAEYTKEKRTNIDYASCEENDQCKHRAAIGDSRGAGAYGASPWIGGAGGPITASYDELVSAAHGLVATHQFHPTT